MSVHSLYERARHIIDDAEQDEEKLEYLAKHDAATVGPAVLLLAVQIAKFRGDIANISVEIAEVLEKKS